VCNFVEMKLCSRESNFAEEDGDEQRIVKNQFAVNSLLFTVPERTME